MLFDPEKITAIYWYSALIGTIIFILKTSLPIDTGSEVTGDFNSTFDSDSSFSVFTVESVAAFFMSGGWMGWFSFAHLHYEIKTTMGIAIASGILGMVFFTWLISKFKKLEHVCTPNINELNGRIGETYTKFLPKGKGKIRIEYNSKLEVLDARNDSSEEINAFSPIRVVKIEQDEIFITKEKN